MKKLFYILFLFMVLTGCDNKSDQSTQSLKVVFEGDSQSVLLSQESDKILGYYNNGIAGSNTINIIDRIKIMKNMEPDIIILTIGTNDMKNIVNIPQGETIEEFKENYIFIIKEYKKITSNIIITSIQPVNSDLFLKTYGRAHQIVRNDLIIEMNLIIKEISKNEQITFIDEWDELYDVESDILKSIYDSGDGLHWNNNACKMHLQNVVNVILENYLKIK